MRPVSTPFRHLHRLTDDAGLFEHAELTVPRVEHGYCVDDVARGLLVTVREPEEVARLTALSEIYLTFLDDAQVADGRFRNRCAVGGAWETAATYDDCWGRALWGLGAAVAHRPALAARALDCFDRSAGGRSPSSRAMAFAGLGAADVLIAVPDHRAARLLLADAAEVIGRPGADPRWPWPEPRLRYANAALAETLIAAGDLLGDAARLDDGLRLLQWLLDVETARDVISVTPVGGWGLGEPRPGFDQQPIEVAALADACARALRVTGAEPWRLAVQRCADWFLGHNDARTALYDPVSGGCCDGLEPEGRNENQGAESTLAMISTFQQSLRHLRRPRP